MSSERDILRGNCHCGAFRFEIHDVQLSQENVLRCECGLCRKKGCFWLPLSQTQDMEVTRDDGMLVEYRGQEFCSVCGTTVLGGCGWSGLEGKKSVNVRCLRGVEVFGLDPLPQIEKAALPSPPLRASCHCGKAVLEVLQPLGELEVREDDCSICTRNAWLGIYPHSTQVSLPPTSLAATTSYAYGRKFNPFPFCSTCGVCVFQTLLAPPAAVVEKLSEAGQERVKKMLEIQPVNVRCLEGVNVDLMSRERVSEGVGGYERDVLGLGQEN